MKIGIDARMLGPKQTGIGNYIKNLIKNIFELDQKNQYFLFLLPEEYQLERTKDDLHFQKYKNVKTVRITAKWYSFSEQSKFLFQLLRRNLDLIHFPHFNVPVLYPKKFIVTIHDLTQSYFPGRSADSKIRFHAYRKTLVTALKKSKKIITVSNYTKKDIFRNFCASPEKPDAFCSSLENKIQVIYEGIDEIFFKKRSPEQIQKFKEKYNLLNPYILYTGVWRKHKNLAGLLYAFKALRKKHKLNYDLCLAGEEHRSYPVQKIIQALAIADYVKCPGFLKQEELPLAYQGASLYCLPSLREGFGFTPLEAMASGVPVISTHTTSLPEILGEAAEYFNPYHIDEITEKMYQVLTDQILRNKLIENGFKQVRNYQWEECARKTLEIYEEILYKKSP